MYLLYLVKLSIVMNCIKCIWFICFLQNYNKNKMKEAKECWKIINSYHFTPIIIIIASKNLEMLNIKCLQKQHYNFL